MRIDFYYDLSCPYAYLGHTQIEALCARHGAELVWKPFLLGGLFRAIGAADAPAMIPAKARMNLLDMHRWAEHWKVPFHMPAEHPCRTVLALRTILASDDIARATKALFAAYWERGLDVSRADVVRQALDGAMFDGAALLERAGTESIKQELRSRTDEAVAAGVFGAPTWVVHGGTADSDSELFWGQDRLRFVDKALGGRGGDPYRAVDEGATRGDRERKRLTFYFDFSSPFAYLAATQIEALGSRQGASVEWQPFLLGGLFRAIGIADVPLFQMPAAKQKHVYADIDRWARYYGVPFTFPSRFPMNSLKPLRVALQLNDEHRKRFASAVFAAYWAEDRDIGDDTVLVDIATKLGLDGLALIAGTHDEAIKARLKRITDDAARLGVFGAPTFVVEDPGCPESAELFWGQDRLDFVERALAKSKARDQR
jgi:2-hydroxychromene-2-carboxylate isomerase